FDYVAGGWTCNRAAKAGRDDDGNRERAETGGQETGGAVFFFSSRRRHTRSVSAFLLNRSSDLLHCIQMDTSVNAANQVVSVGADIAFDADPKFFACLVRFESSSVPTTLPTAYDVYPLDGRHDGGYYTVKDCVTIDVL